MPLHFSRGLWDAFLNSCLNTDRLHPSPVLVTQPPVNKSSNACLVTQGRKNEEWMDISEMQHDLSAWEDWSVSGENQLVATKGKFQPILLRKAKEHNHSCRLICPCTKLYELMLESYLEGSRRLIFLNLSRKLGTDRNLKNITFNPILKSLNLIPLTYMSEPFWNIPNSLSERLFKYNLDFLIPQRVYERVE